MIENNKRYKIRLLAASQCLAEKKTDKGACLLIQGKVIVLVYCKSESNFQDAT